MEIMTGVDRSFWKGKRVFLTGHTGFKGSWLALWLQNMGAQVYGLSLKPAAQPNHFELAQIEKGMVSRFGDIRDYSVVEAHMKEAQPEVVLHLAAQALVRYSYSHPLETYSTNVMGTAHVLEAVRQVKTVRSVVVVTTDKCYENKEWHWGYRENDPMGGYDPYSSSKGAAELVVSAYRRSFFSIEKFSEHRVALASARAGNVIGGGDWALDRLVPDILTAFSKGEVVNIRSPHSIRPWQHVLEPLSGYLLLAQKLFAEGASFSEAYNFGPADRDCQPVEFIVKNLAEMWGGGARWQIDKNPQPHEASFLKLDSSKAHNRLDWWPRWSLRQALGATVEWYRAFGSEKTDMRELSVAQISNYLGKTN